MADQENDLPFGLYERLITAGLKARLLRFDPAAARVVSENADPMTSGHYSLKMYTSEKAKTEDGWEHTRTVLKPVPDFDSIVLTPKEESDVRVVAEFAQVLNQG